MTNEVVEDAKTYSIPLGWGTLTLDAEQLSAIFRRVGYVLRPSDFPRIVAALEELRPDLDRAAFIGFLRSRSVGTERDLARTLAEMIRDGAEARCKALPERRGRPTQWGPAERAALLGRYNELCADAIAHGTRAYSRAAITRLRVELSEGSIPAIGALNIEHESLQKTVRKLRREIGRSEEPNSGQL